MYVFTDERKIVNLDRFSGVSVLGYAGGKEGQRVVGAIYSDNTYMRLCVCDSEREATLIVQEICTALDNCKRVFYIGSYEPPF